VSPQPERPSAKAYPQWLRNEHSVSVSDALENRYDSVTAKLLRDLSTSSFWQELVASLKTFDDEYRVSCEGYPLLMPGAPSLLVKPYKSFIEKTYRRNIVENRNWPAPPRGGWLLPDRCFGRINDLIRTTISVKYLDGVEFLAERIEQLAIVHGARFNLFLEAREQGYYAGHAYVRQEVEIPGPQWDTEQISASLEIQLTTQLQEVIRRLLHKYYEDRRSKSKSDDGQPWQWNYESDEFVANYLGHLLHYIEGMIMEVRARQSQQVSGA
jgi:hypothetical protein